MLLFYREIFKKNQSPLCQQFPLVIRSNFFIVAEEKKKHTEMGLNDVAYWKKFLEQLFPDCILQAPHEFKEAIEGADVVMYDLNIIAHNECGSSYSKNSLDTKLQNFFMNQFSVFNNAKRIIGTMDDSQHVPKAKKIEQMDRDEKQRRRGVVFTPEEISALGRHAHLTKWTDENVSMHVVENVLRSGFEMRERKKEEKKQKIRKKRKTEQSQSVSNGVCSQEEKEKKERDKLFVYFLERVLHTRETRSDLLHYITKRLLSIPVPLIHGREIIMDGVPYAEYPMHTVIPHKEYYDKKGNDITRYVDIIDEQDIYGGFYDCKVSRFLIKKKANWNGSNPRTTRISEYETKMIGEGDIKSAYWISECAKEKKSLYFQCADTDLIVIILILFKCLDANRESIPQLFLDVTHNKNIPDRESVEEGSPDAFYRKMCETRKVYAMHDLYYTLKTRLSKMWPGVNDPVMTFCLAAMANGTDFFSSPNFIGIGTVTKAVLCGGYTLLDRAVTLSFIKNEDDENDHSGEAIPTAVINEQRLMEFWKYCYSVLKYTTLKKDNGVDTSSLEKFMKQINSARMVMWPTKGEVVNGKNQESYTEITGLKYSRVDLVDKRFSELVEFSERKTSHLSGDEDYIDEERKPHELMCDALTLPFENDELFDYIKRELIHDDDKLKKYWKGSSQPESEEKIYAHARRWAWNLLYWVFAYRCSFSDVSLTINQEGKSHFGYKEEIDKLTGSTRVQHSDHVFSV